MDFKTFTMTSSFHIDILCTNLEGMFNDNNNRGGESKEVDVVRGFKIGKGRQELEDWAAWLANQEHTTSTMDEETIDKDC
jgi:hypothetical protein